MKRISFVVIALALQSCAIEKESMSMFLAKEMCSCHFLVGQSDKSCRDSIRFSLAMGDITVDEKKKEVTGKAEDGSHPVTFKYVSADYGCSLKQERSILQSFFAAR